MSREKQIEEMAAIAAHCCDCRCMECDCIGTGEASCYEVKAANALYNAGYRKQGWISVEERLPERNGRYLTHCNIEGQSLVCVLYYCKIGGFNEGTVTHWMPLPEAPKMKGDGDE